MGYNFTVMVLGFTVYGSGFCNFFLKGLGFKVHGYGFWMQLKGLGFIFLFIFFEGFRIRVRV
jgi:hypothetical protein